MQGIILIILTFCAVVGVKEKALNAKKDFPSSIMDGAVSFFNDFKKVVCTKKIQKSDTEKNQDSSPLEEPSSDGDESNK
ncbi:hypothetical protein [Photobacterium kishitanii]|uniref:Uncharacterized protein n=1 Tax=Photobacterium kishitanii TaxID=318456 RepID=A0A2T3KMW6_9GAMM|nr:hypothetical protein [Photobacterium kishitanii]PSV01139.1 hypothetical protein C9J27_03710 [Photobacterium kishitanii]